MYNLLIQRRVRSAILERFGKSGHIVYIPDNRDYTGADAPFCVCSKQGTILDSFKEKKEAKQYLRNCDRFAAFDPMKEEEIIVWMRIQKGKDRQEILDFSIDKFNLSEYDAERLFNIAFPDGIDIGIESEDAKELDKISAVNLRNLIDTMLGNKQSLISPDLEKAKLIIASILRNKKLL